jgi:TPR repeat protein
LAQLAFGKWGPAISEEQAIATLKKAHEMGDAGAAFMMADAHILGRGVPQDTEAAIRWLQEVNEANREIAQNRIAEIRAGEYEADTRFAYSIPQKSFARFDLEKRIQKAEAGNAGASFDVSQAYRFALGVYQNGKLASLWMDRAIEQGLEVSKTWEEYSQQNSIEATYRYAAMLRDGDGVEADIEKSNGLFFQAGYLQSHYTSMTELAFIHRHGRGTIEKNLIKARSYFEIAANWGEPLAQFQVGHAHATGSMDFPIDYAKAESLIRASADQGYNLARAILAKMYEQGELGEAKPRLAAAYLLRILDGNFVYRPHHYGYGPIEWLWEDAPKEVVIGRELMEIRPINAWPIIKAAAEEGAPYGAEVCAIALTIGFGTIMDHTEAHRWHNVAKERGETIIADQWFNQNAYLREVPEMLKDRSDESGDGS